MCWLWDKQKIPKTKWKTCEVWNGVDGRASWPAWSLLREMETLPCAKHALCVSWVCSVSSRWQLLLLLTKQITQEGRWFSIKRNYSSFFSFQMGYQVPGWYQSSFTNWARLDKPFHYNWDVQGFNERLFSAAWWLFAGDKTVCLVGDLAHPGGISYALVLPAADKEAMVGEHEILRCCLKAEGCWKPCRKTSACNALGFVCMVCGR